MGRQIYLAAQAGPPCGSQACRNDRNGYEHPILDLDPKDTESLNEHMHGRFLPAECKTANRKTYYFYIYDLAASVGGLFRSRRACPRKSRRWVEISGGFYSHQCPPGDHQKVTAPLGACG